MSISDWLSIVFFFEDYMNECNEIERKSSIIIWRRILKGINFHNWDSLCNVTESVTFD